MSDTVERTSSSQISQAGDRPAAAASSAEPRSALGPLLALIDERVPVERRETVAAFAKAYLRRLADDEIAAAPAEELYGLVCSTFEFVDGRRLHPWVVRAFNPEVAKDGFTAPGTILETNVDDSPFLVDSVTEELTARNLVVRRILHPVIGTSRDEEGRLERVSSARDASHRESVMHFELDRRLADASRADLEERVKTILRDVRLVVRDFEPMQDRAHHMLELARLAAVRYSPQEVGETVDFLDWLLQLNFVFLGYREYELVDTPDGRAIRAAAGSGLGILSNVEPLDVRRHDACWTRSIRDCATHRGRGPVGLLEDQRVLDGPSARSHGLHRRTAREPRGRDHRRGPHDRALHVEGVHGACREDAAPAPQARAGAHRGGSDPRIA